MSKFEKSLVCYSYVQRMVQECVCQFHINGMTLPFPRLNWARNCCFHAIDHFFFVLLVGVLNLLTFRNSEHSKNLPESRVECVCVCVCVRACVCVCMCPLCRWYGVNMCEFVRCVLCCLSVQPECVVFRTVPFVWCVRVRVCGVSV